MAAEVYADLYARVIQVYRQQQGEEKKFLVETRKSGDKYTCSCRFFCPVDVGDLIYAECRMDDDKHLTIVRPPLVEPFITKDNVIKSFIFIAKLGYNQAAKLYNELEKRNGDVVIYLSNLAEKWVSTRDPVLLAPFNVMDKQKADNFLTKWHKQHNIRRLYLLGLNNTEIKACNMTTNEIYERCRSNPLTLPAISIKKAIEIMSRLNKEPEGIDLRCGEIVRTLYEHIQKRCYVGTPSRIILNHYPDFLQYKDKLEKEYEVVCEYFTVYLKKMRDIEQKIADYIHYLIKNNHTNPITLDPCYDCGDKTLNEKQRIAVQHALADTISITSGKAGVGKTLSLKCVTNNLLMLGKNFVVCSFTGKAANVASRAINLRAYTIHSLITLYSSLPRPMHMIIIDEASMLNGELFLELIEVAERNREKTDPPLHFLFCGDINQLVGLSPIDIMYELLKIKEINVTYLTENKRLFFEDGRQNGIAVNLEKIVSKVEDHDGKQKPVNYKREEVAEVDPFDELEEEDIERLHAFDPFDKTGDFDEFSNFHMIPQKMDFIYDIALDLKNKGIPQTAVTVLCPYNRYLKALNDKFQLIFNGDNPYVEDFWNQRFHIGDRVICRENSQEYGIFNGSEGQVVDFDDKVLKMRFHSFEIKDGKGREAPKVIEVPLAPRYRRGAVIDEETGDPVEYDEFCTNKFKLGYAISVHISQGSEYHAVVLFLPFDIPKASTFINRNLVYTGLSRAQKMVYVVGNIRALQSSISIPTSYRHNTLSKRILKLLEMK